MWQYGCSLEGFRCDIRAPTANCQLPWPQVPPPQLASLVSGLRDGVGLLAYQDLVKTLLWRSKAAARPHSAHPMSRATPSTPPAGPRGAGSGQPAAAAPQAGSPPPAPPAPTAQPAAPVQQPQQPQQQPQLQGHSQGGAATPPHAAAAAASRPETPPMQYYPEGDGVLGPEALVSQGRHLSYIYPI